MDEGPGGGPGGDARQMGIYAGKGGSRLEITDSLVARTLSELATDEQGSGVWAEFEAKVTLSGTAVTGNRLAGVGAILGADIELDTCLLDDTRSGNSAQLGPMGDGLMVADSRVLVDGVLATHNFRAGLLFSETTGSVAGVTSINNHFGYVAQGSQQPQVIGELRLEDNAAESPDAADLPVANTPIEAPDLPGSSP